MSRIEMTTPVVPAFAKFAQRISVPFSPVVRAGDWVYVSGLAPVNPETGGYDILTIEQQARRGFAFLNRLDEVILFTSLTDEDLLRIIHLLVDQVNINLVAKQIKIRVADDAAKYILEKTLTDRSYGARPLRRALQKYVEAPLSEGIIQGTLPRPADFEVYLGDTGIFCRQIQEQPVGAGGPGEEQEQAAGTPLYLF